MVAILSFEASTAPAGPGGRRQHHLSTPTAFSRLERPRRLRSTWRWGSTDLERYGAALDTVVTWTLAPSASGGTLLRLEHSGFTPRNGFAFDAMGKGWREAVATRIASHLAALG